MNKIKEKFNLISNTNKTLSIFLLIAISLSIIGIAFAVTPNPGHDFTTVDGGVAQGDILYGDATDSLVVLAKNITATRYLSNTGATNNPAWAQIDLTNGVTGILPSGNGGTTNAFFTVSGPATVAKTFTFPDANATVLTTNAAVTVAQGGTGLTSTAQGDILYSSAASTLSALAKDITATRYLSNTGASNNPAWAQIDLTNGVTGILPTANGGTGMAFFTAAGPTTARVYTFPDAAATVLTSNAAVTVAQGGTGLTTLTANNVILGNGASNPTFVAPGTSGNVLTSNGTTWSSTAPSVRSVFNQSVTTPAAGFASDTYLVGSSTAIPATGLRVGTRYHLIFQVSKTNAGTATPILNIRFGTAGAIGDVSRCAMTWTAQTAATDTGTFEVWATFRTIGSGSSAVIQCAGQRRHGASVTGLGNLVSQVVATTGGGFDSTVANSIIGTSVNGGTSAAWTITLVQAELTNLP